MSNERYRVRDRDKLDAPFFNSRFGDIHARLSGLEQVRATWDSELAGIQGFALQRVNEVLKPTFDAYADLASLGTLLSATSADELTVATGQLGLTIVPEHRERFAPAGWLSITGTDPDNAMLGQLVSYDRETGLLTLNIEQVKGAGAHSGWTVAISRPPGLDWGPFLGIFPSAAALAAEYPTTSAGNFACVLVAGAVPSIAVYDDDPSGWQVASPDLAAFALAARTITGAGLATGGGSLAANRTIDVPIASQAEAEAGTAANKAMTPQRTAQAVAALATGVPVGACISFPATTPPAGFIKRNGATLSRATYADLWAYAQASGNLAASEGAKDTGQFGPGDGSTTFSIPDGRGEFDRGWDDGRGVDSGRGIGTSQAEETKSHQHHSGYGNYYNTGARYGYATGLAACTTPDDEATYSAGYTTQAAKSSSTGGAETRPRNVALLACIKY